MSISSKNQKVIWGQSAGICSICKKKLIQTIANESLEPLGEIAHIEGENEGSKRYNPAQTIADRNDPKNLILLCPSDHTLIDRDDITYTVPVLYDLKEKHILFVLNATKAELQNVTFAELQVIVSYLVSNNTSFDVSTSFDHVTPKEKIDKNKLSNSNASLIAMGMTRVKQVKEYLNTNPDVDFSERLRSRLSEYYNEEKGRESDPNVIFSNMLDYMSEGSNDFKKRASALSVLTYFFETCDIFEK
jgi:hypothetical protein